MLCCSVVLRMFVRERNYVQRERERERGRCLYCNRLLAKKRQQEIVVSVPHLCIPLIAISCSLWAPVVFPIFGFSTLTFCALSLGFMFFVHDPTSRLGPSIVQRIDFLSYTTYLHMRSFLERSRTYHMSAFSALLPMYIFPMIHDKSSIQNQKNVSSQDTDQNKKGTNATTHLCAKLEQVETQSSTSSHPGTHQKNSTTLTSLGEESADMALEDEERHTLLFKDNPISIQLSGSIQTVPRRKPSLACVYRPLHAGTNFFVQ